MTATVVVEEAPTVRLEARPDWIIPPGAVVEWRDLAVALDELWRGWRRLPVCAEDPGLWWSSSPKARARAVELCQSCPVVFECAAFARASKERDGVWGGLTPAERGSARGGKRVAS